MIVCPVCQYSFDLKQRTKPQNRSYWGLIVTPFARYIGFTNDECHELLKEHCNSELEHITDKKGIVHEVRRIKSTTGLTKQEFSDYELRCRLFTREWDFECQVANEQPLQDM